MSHDKRPDRLTNDLQQLGSPGASAGFTQRVLASLDERQARRRSRRTLMTVFAVPTMVAVIAGSIYFADARSKTRQAEELRAQHRALQAELAELERARDRSQTVLYLGTGQDYDLVLDLEPLLDRSISAPVVPALQDLRGRPARMMEASRRQP